MLRWLWFVLAVLCFAVAFRTHSMGLAAVTLLAALGFLLMGTLQLASSRIEAGGRSVSELLGPDEIRHVAQMEQRKLESAASDKAARQDEPDAQGDAEARTSAANPPTGHV